MRKDIDEAYQKEESKRKDAETLKGQFEELKEANVQFYAEATGFQRIFETYESLKKHKGILETNRAEQLDGMEVMKGEFSRNAGADGLETTDELEHMLKNFETHLATVKAKRDKQEDLKKKEDEALEELRRRERHLASTQGGLIANRKVSYVYTAYLARRAD